MIKSIVFLGLPLDFQNICKVYPPTVNEIIVNNFDLYYSLLTITQETIDDDLLKLKEINEDLYIPTPIEFLLASCYNSEEFYNNLKNAFQFFIHEDITCLYEAKTILIGDLEQELLVNQSTDNLRLITEDNFVDFQNIIRASCGRSPYKPLEDLSQLPPKIRDFKLKARERDKIKARKEAKNAPSLDTCLASICCMGIGITPLNIGEISYASVNKLIETNQKHEKYDLDCRSLMMGADPKKIKMEYWIRDTKENE